MASKRRLHSLVLLAICTIGFTTIAADSHWGYPDLDGGEDFPKWGGLCDAGRRQSPINLSLMGALKGVYDVLDFINYENEQTDMELVNNGHSIQLYGFSPEMQLEGGPLKERYIAEQLHLHWWSEHTIDNIRYPLEVHIVHRNKLYPNMATAVGHKDGLAVVAILYHVSTTPNAAIEKILQSMGAVKSAANVSVPVKMKEPLVPRELFPQISGYMTYPGSLTTPGCDESVQWIVLQKTFPVTMEQVDEFEDIETEAGKFLKNNYRNIQNQNHRPIIAVNEDRENAAATPTYVALSSALLLAVATTLLR